MSFKIKKGRLTCSTKAKNLRTIDKKILKDLKKDKKVTVKLR